MAIFITREKCTLTLKKCLLKISLEMSVKSYTILFYHVVYNHGILKSAINSGFQGERKKAQ